MWDILWILLLYLSESLGEYTIEDPPAFVILLRHGDMYRASIVLVFGIMTPESPSQTAGSPPRRYLFGPGNAGASPVHQR